MAAKVGNIVVLIFGILIALGGAYALIIFQECNTLLGGSSLGFGSVCQSEEYAGVLGLLVGLLMIAASLLTWDGKRKRRK
ncbi:MAG: hypothetical protein ACYDFT_00295 [Thermoplasmata archaeon]